MGVFAGIVFGAIVAAIIGGVTYGVTSNLQSPQRHQPVIVIRPPQPWTEPPRRIPLPQAIQPVPTFQTTPTKLPTTSPTTTPTTSPPNPRSLINESIASILNFLTPREYTRPILILSPHLAVNGIPRAPAVGGYWYDVRQQLPEGNVVYEILVRLGPCALAGEHIGKKYLTIFLENNSFKVPLSVEYTSSLLSVVMSYQNGHISKYTGVGKFLNNLVKRGYEIYLRWAPVAILTNDRTSQISQVRNDLQRQLAEKDLDGYLDVLLDALEKVVQRVKRIPDPNENISQSSHIRIPGSELSSTWNNTWLAGRTSRHSPNGDDNYEVALAIMFECSMSFEQPRGEVANTVAQNLFDHF